MINVTIKQLYERMKQFSEFEMMYICNC